MGSLITRCWHCHPRTSASSIDLYVKSRGWFDGVISLTRPRRLIYFLCSWFVSILFSYIFSSFSFFLMFLIHFHSCCFHANHHAGPKSTLQISEQARCRSRLFPGIQAAFSAGPSSKRNVYYSTGINTDLNTARLPARAGPQARGRIRKGCLRNFNSSANLQ